jgi:hypothetical protein
MRARLAFLLSSLTLGLGLGFTSCRTDEPPVPRDGGASARSASPAASVVAPAPSAAASGAPITPRQIDQLYALVDEMLAPKAPARSGAGTRGPMMLYAHAFAGYALVNLGSSALRERDSARARLDLLIDRVMRPELSAAFRAGKASRSWKQRAAIAGSSARSRSGRAPREHGNRTCETMLVAIGGWLRFARA